MTTLYLVSNREYSDGGTLAIFSTKELAENFCRVFNKSATYNKAEIEEYELDQSELSNIGKYYCSALIDPQFNMTQVTIELLTKDAPNLFDVYEFIVTPSKFYNNTFVTPRSLRVVRLLALEGAEVIETRFAQICSNIMRHYVLTGNLEGYV